MVYQLGADVVRRRQAPPLVAQNPFVTPAPVAPPVEVMDSDPLWDDAIVLSGPSTPAAAPHVDISDESPWPTMETSHRPSVCVMGLHGGAGATTLAGLLGGDVLEVGGLWPVATGWERPLPSLPVVAVARTHYQGLTVASRFARLWAAGALPSSTLLGLVLVDDGPKLVASQRQAAKRLGRMTPHGWHLPWNEMWRIQPPIPQTTPIRARRVIENIRAQARNHRKDVP